MKKCEYCKKEIQIKYGERPSKFNKKKYCNNVCQIKMLNLMNAIKRVFPNLLKENKKRDYVRDARYINYNSLSKLLEQEFSELIKIIPIGQRRQIQYLGNYHVIEKIGKKSIKLVKDLTPQ